MIGENEKCVIVVDESLPLGVIVNAAAILGVTLGASAPDVVGDDVSDADRNLHKGIIRFPVPVLKADAQRLRTIRARLREPGFSELTAVDFSDCARGCKTYGEFIGKMENTPESGLRYIGLAILGDTKRVARLTGNLPLLR